MSTTMAPRRTVPFQGILMTNPGNWLPHRGPHEFPKRVLSHTYIPKEFCMVAWTEQISNFPVAGQGRGGGRGTGSVLVPRTCPASRTSSSLSFSLSLSLCTFRSVHISVQHPEVSGREGPYPPCPGQDHRHLDPSDGQSGPDSAATAPASGPASPHPLSHQAHEVRRPWVSHGREVKQSSPQQYATAGPGRADA